MTIGYGSMEVGGALTGAWGWIGQEEARQTM